MSKKWITILVAAVVASMLSTSAFAACRVTLLGPAATAFSFTDSTKAATITDPVPLTPGDKVSLVTPNTGAAVGLPLNVEGVTERVSDLLITDDGLGTNFCFPTGGTLVITFNGILTNPPTPGALAIPGNLDIYDSNGIGGLTVSSANITQGFAANTTQSIITIAIGQTGSTGDLTVGATGAGLRVKNLRINASLLQGTLPNIAANFVFTANVTLGAGPTAVSFVNGAGTTAGTNTVVGGQVGVANLTVDKTTQPAVPVTGGIATGIQNSGRGLRGGWTGLAFHPGFSTAFRFAGGTCNSTTSPATTDTCVSQVANDIATVATSLAWSFSNVPSGVTITLPSKFDMTASNTAANALIFNARSTSLSNSGAAGTFSAIYDTSSSSGATPGNVIIETADNVDTGTAVGATAATNTNPNCTTDSNGNYPANLNAGSPCDTNPKIGVLIGTSSAAGTVSLNLAFGPSDTSLFTGDDAATTGLIPRYTGSAAPTGSVFAGGGTGGGVTAPAANVQTLYIVKSTKFFTITPTRSTLLFPFVSTIGGFNTGISIVNSCADSLGTTANSVYGSSTNSCTQTGGITLFFFGVDPTNANAPVQVSLNSDLTAGGVSLASACRGLDSNGKVAPGHGVACALSNLLPLLGGPKGFDGYVIVVTGFNNGHGFSAQFDAAGNPFGANPALQMFNTTRTTGAGEALGN